MAQTEDTELRDLVIEALEKNGSLAKIRALLRANVFLAFENECENIKQNASLDNILKLPEGILSLSIVHEFLESCNLKNTLFVFMAESRQRKAYVYEGQKMLAEKLNLPKNENTKEPILVTLLRNGLKQSQRTYSHEKCSSNKDDQNCTYIVHEDSSSACASSNSQSDNSSDEKNKLHLRLHLDNSDTDTSSDSARDKSSSEYIPNQHIVIHSDIATTGKSNFVTQLPNYGEKTHNFNFVNTDKDKNAYYLQDLKQITNSSSDSTSYIDLKPYNPLDQKLLNTAGVPLTEADGKQMVTPYIIQSASNSQMEKPIPEINAPKVDQTSPATLSSVSSLSLKMEDERTELVKASLKVTTEESGKSDVETAEYSYDFTSSPVIRKNDSKDKIQSPESGQEELVTKSLNKNSSVESQQNSQSSQSSVSISDVADLISANSFGQQLKNENDLSNNSKSKLLSTHSKNVSGSNKLSDDSGDFSESPVPSLSNLSLDIHSD